MMKRTVNSAKHAKPCSKALRGGVAKRLASIVAVSLTAACLFAGVAFSAESEDDVMVIASNPTVGASESTAVYEKSEVIYATLSATGEPEALYVTNRFDVTQAGVIVDYGAYDAVYNLSDSSAIQRDGDASKLTVEEGVSLYQGDVLNMQGAEAPQLPWGIELSYCLNGQSVSPEDLAGKSGSLSVNVEIAKNESSDAAFFESYMLQITFTLDGDTCSNVNAEGATIALSGRDRTVAFTALPGSESSFELTAQVRDFEMAGVQIVALPYAMVMEMPDTSEMEEGMSDLSDAVSQLSKGTASLADGIGALTSGAYDLASGASAFGTGLDRLDASAGDLVNASAQIDAALKKVASEIASADLSGLDQIGQLPAGLRALADGLDGASGLAPQVRLVQDGLAQAKSALDQYMGNLPTGSEVSAAQIQLLLEAAVAADASAADGGNRWRAAVVLIDAYEAAATARAVYFGYNGGQGAQHALAGASTLVEVLAAPASTQGSLAYFASMLRQIADGIDAAFNQDMMDKIDQLIPGMQELSSNYSAFHGGLVEFSSGLKTLSSNYNDLESGVSQLAYGTSQLANGASTLNSGVSELNANTITLPEEMRAQIDEMMVDYDFPEFDPRSFVSAKNSDVTAVQFVMTTAAIQVPEAPAEEEPEEEELTFWDRLLALFR